MYLSSSMGTSDSKCKIIRTLFDIEAKLFYAHKYENVTY